MKKQTKNQSDLQLASEMKSVKKQLNKRMGSLKKRVSFKRKIGIINFPKFWSVRYDGVLE